MCNGNLFVVGMLVMLLIFALAFAIVYWLDCLRQDRKYGEWLHNNHDCTIHDFIDLNQRKKSPS